MDRNNTDGGHDVETSKAYQLFVDLDGVLVDFDAGVEALFGAPPDLVEPKRLWPRLAKTPGFYDTLGWTLDGKVLWEFVRDFNPIVLTGLPRGAWAEPQKRAWCARELGSNVPVITCQSKEKAQKAAEACGPGRTPVLIDDRLSLKESFDQIDSVFIHHRSAEESISNLRKLLF